ncbi:MAG TPA: SRPBCC family protein [Kofleriaceae bacterium]|nr:SRPBCC family protein [Kofleriaceae bacterium]
MYDRPDLLDQQGLGDSAEDTPFDARHAIDPTEELLLTEIDDLPAEVEEPSAPPEPRSAAVTATGNEVLSTSLPLDAAVAFEAFCDAEAIPRWLSVVQSVRVLSRTQSGRPQRVAFVGRLQNATIGYTLFYRYSEAERAVSWGTEPGSMTLVAGRAQFIPLGERATLMQYQLALELPAGALPPWEDPLFSGHATSVVMNDFREYVIRVHRRT